MTSQMGVTRRVTRLLPGARVRPDPTDVTFLRWSSVPFEAPGPPESTIEDVLEHRHSGFTITGVLDPDEAARAVERFDRHAAELRKMGDGHEGWHEVGYGATWGTPVNQSWDGDRSAYLARVDETVDRYHEIFGFDITERLQNAFSRYSGRYAVEVVEEDGQSYLPGSFREMRPGAGGLPAHTGNEFFEMGADGPLTHLRAITEWKDSLSFFLMLAPAGKGGELLLYDLTWDDRPEIRGFNNFDRDDSPLDAYEGAWLRPGAGDLVWFRGGDQWHKVTQIKRSSRITFGGFAAPLTTGDTIVHWS